MKSIANQIRRNFVDDGRNDRVFAHQEQKLKEAIERLKQSSEKLYRASKDFQDSLLSGLGFTRRPH